MSDTLAKITDLLNVKLEEDGGVIDFPFNVEKFCYDNDLVLSDRDRLADENKRLREALEFYADEKNHEIRHANEGIGPDPFIYRDGGKIAREALGNET